MATLFSYFDKVPRKRSPSADSGGCDENDTGITPKRKRKKICVIESDESGEDSLSVDIPSKADEAAPNVDTSNVHTHTPSTPKGLSKGVGPSSTPKGLSKGVGPASKFAGSTPSRKKPGVADAECPFSEGLFLHDKLKWLQKEYIKDKKGHGRAHADYDQRTLMVPQEYYKKLTPGLQQWWNIKADHFDSVIMFKVGKFYELYHMDAVVGVRELGLVFMRSESAHCGFPEASFGRYSDSLVQKGYKVVRVEQVETPAMMEKRIKKMSGVSKSDRVVRREVCSIITKGTRTLNFFNGDTFDGKSLFLLAVKELPTTGEAICNKIFGVCFVDTCVGTFNIGQFEDDAESSKLRTLLAHFPPGHILHEKHGLLPHTTHFIDVLFPSSVKDALIAGVEFWGASKTIQALSEGNYFNGDGDDASIRWPPVLKAMFSDAVGFSVSSNFELAVSALGACVWCLKQAHVDHSLLSLASFELYNPQPAQVDDQNAGFSNKRLILDDITLTNLDIISPDNRAGTLLDRVDSTVTPFGKRLLRRWICAPLADTLAIKARQDAVEQLLRNPLLMAQAKDVLQKLPDLERLLRKIHSQGCQTKWKDKPDSRAIFFEHVMYSKRKIGDFVAVLDGLRLSLEVLETFSPALESLKSILLLKLLTVKDGNFPDLKEQLTFYENSFDRVKAKDEGIIIPNKGVNLEYDIAQEQVNDILKETDQYLLEQKRRLNCKNVTYWGSGRNRFQLEIPVSALSSHKIQDYELTSQRKGVRRYRTPAIDLMLKKLEIAEERRDRSLQDTMEKLFYSFDEHFTLWEQAVQCLSVLDVLMSLATYSSSASEEMTRPILVDPTTTTLLEVCNGRHPCIIHTHSGEYIPNDVLIEGQTSCLLVTGPNMGGKSTLMRQTGLLVVLAQLGCYVPATKCKLSPVDRIFTRMGACDRIMARESTFFLELKEMRSILHHATQHSLVLVDELGRGTATYDGAAIAYAVLQQLSQVLKCRTLFSTHYHFLVEQFIGNPRVKLGHMACLVQGEGHEESITFLYKFTEGACPNSYGFNVAQLAGLPASVVSLAKKKAKVCEREARHVRIIRKLLQQDVCLRIIGMNIDRAPN